jgi:hypothetical protein
MWTARRLPIAVKPPAAMKIGDLVLYQRRSYYLRGSDPMSVPNRQAFLQDPSIGEELMVPAGEIVPDPSGEGACLKEE